MVLVGVTVLVGVRVLVGVTVLVGVRVLVGVGVGEIEQSPSFVHDVLLSTQKLLAPA